MERNFGGGYEGRISMLTFKAICDANMDIVTMKRYPQAAWERIFSMRRWLGRFRSNRRVSKSKPLIEKSINSIKYPKICSSPFFRTRHEYAELVQRHSGSCSLQTSHRRRARRITRRIGDKPLQARSIAFHCAFWALRREANHLPFLEELRKEQSVTRRLDYLVFPEPPADATNECLRVVIGEMKSSEAGVASAKR